MMARFLAFVAGSVILFSPFAFSFECSVNDKAANAYCFDHCRSLNPGHHANGYCARDEMSCLCQNLDGKRIKVRVIEDQTPKPHVEPTPQIIYSQPFVKPTEEAVRTHRAPRPLPGPPVGQKLVCDGSIDATATCNAFCVEVVNGTSGICNLEDLTCRCKDVQFIRKDPIDAVYVHQSQHPPVPPSAAFHGQFPYSPFAPQQNQLNVDEGLHHYRQQPPVNLPPPQSVPEGHPMGSQYNYVAQPVPEYYAASHAPFPPLHPQNPGIPQEPMDLEMNSSASLSQPEVPVPEEPVHGSRPPQLIIPTDAESEPASTPATITEHKVADENVKSPEPENHAPPVSADPSEPPRLPQIFASNQGQVLTPSLAHHTGQPMPPLHMPPNGFNAFPSMYHNTPQQFYPYHFGRQPYPPQHPQNFFMPGPYGFSRPWPYQPMNVQPTISTGFRPIPTEPSMTVAAPPIAVPQPSISSVSDAKEEAPLPSLEIMPRTRLTAAEVPAEPVDIAEVAGTTETPETTDGTIIEETTLVFSSTTVKPPITAPTTKSTGFSPPPLIYGFRGIPSRIKNAEKRVFFEAIKQSRKCAMDDCKQTCAARGFSSCTPLCMPQGCHCSCSYDINKYILHPVYDS